MASSNARNVRIKESAFYNARRDINNNTHHIQGDYNNHAINIHGEHDPRSCVHSAMKDYIDTDAYHDSGARRDPSRCYPGTREAALKTIFDWAQCSASHCLWLYGPAGTGKSAIARTFSDHCCQDKTLGATYFFTRGSTSSPGPPPLFSTLIYQLMSVFPSLDEHLWEVIRMDRTIFRRSLSTQLDKLIVQPFLKLADKSTSAVVVIDGLDECDGDSIQGEIVRLILSLERHSLPLLFLISSRPESEIRRAFESFPRSSLARIPLDKALHPDRDIRHFLVSEFERIYQQSVRMGMPPVSQLPWPPTEDVETLVQKSSGHFIYAATVIRFVEEDRAHPMDRLDAILDIPNGSTSSSATFAHSIAFQELDNLYLHILRKQHLNRVRLVKILHTIAHLSRYNSRFSPTLSSPSNIEVIFDLRPGTVRFMLEGLLSIIDVPASANYWQPLRFFHASFNDFLVDPERSTHEFYLETSRFNAELACEYMRLIVGFSPSKSRDVLSHAIEVLRDCLEATAGLLSATLERLVNIITQESESTPPCRRYIILDFFLRKILNGFPGAEAGRKHCETIIQRVRPQLIELSDGIFTVLRVLGAWVARGGHFWGIDSSVEKIGWLLGIPNGLEDIFQRTLDLDHDDDLCHLFGSRGLLRQIPESLRHWLLTCHQLKPPTANIWHNYPEWIQHAWAWAWGAYPSIHLRVVHNIDLNYGCFRVLVLQFRAGQPLNLISPQMLVMLKLASASLSSTCGGDPLDDPTGAGEYWSYLVCNQRWLHLGFAELIDLKAIGLISALRVLPDFATTFYPGLYYLHCGLDWLHYRLHSDQHPSSKPIPHHQEFLEIIYSRLLQDPLASRVVPVIYAMRARMPPETIAQWLGLAPEVLYQSVAMQGLFGIGLWGGAPKRPLPISRSLGVLLKMGRVKLQAQPGQSGYHIDDCMPGAHEYLAFSCAKYFNDGYLGWYAKQYWSQHLKHAEPSERLFETLRRVVIRGCDIEPVIQWLEESPGVPEDILARWRAAQVDPGITDVSTIDDRNSNPKLGCHLDRAFQERLDRLAWARRIDGDGEP